MDDRRMLLLSILYRFVRCLLGLTTVLMRRDLSKDEIKNKRARPRAPGRCSTASKGALTRSSGNAIGRRTTLLHWGDGRPRRAPSWQTSCVFGGGGPGSPRHIGMGDDQLAGKPARKPAR